MAEVKLLAMVNRTDLRTIRDLNQSHLGLLKNIKLKMENYIAETYNCDVLLYFQ